VWCGVVVVAIGCGRTRRNAALRVAGQGGSYRRTATLRNVQNPRKARDYEISVNSGGYGRMNVRICACNDNAPHRLMHRRSLANYTARGRTITSSRHFVFMLSVQPLPALETAALRHLTHKRIAIYTDAQAAIRRMGSDEPGPGQKYSLEARKHIATIPRRRPGVTAELRWRPAHKEVSGNEKVDEWAKLAAHEPEAHGVEHLRLRRYGDLPGPRRQPPRPLAHLKRSMTEVKWQEAKNWAEQKLTGKKYRYSRLGEQF